MFKTSSGWSKTPPTIERLKEVLHYDHESGVFTWKIATCNRNKPGDVAGAHTKSGYIYITIDSKKYQAGNIAWYYMTGEWFSGIVDHKDLNRGNNSFLNLRKADRRMNVVNTPKRSNTSSKWKGVSWSKRSKRWIMQFKFKGLKIVRSFRDEREAAEEYMFFALEHHGEFARFD